MLSSNSELVQTSPGRDASAHEWESQLNLRQRVRACNAPFAGTDASSDTSRTRGLPVPKRPHPRESLL